MNINKVIICGRVTDAGPKLTYSSEGNAQYAFTLMVEEPGRDGAPFRTLLRALDIEWPELPPLELWGRTKQPCRSWPYWFRESRRLANTLGMGAGTGGGADGTALSVGSYTITVRFIRT